MRVPYYKGKKLTPQFSRKNSGSLIIHENGFWPFLAILSSFAVFLADFAYSDRWSRSSSININQNAGKGH